MYAIPLLFLCATAVTGGHSVPSAFGEGTSRPPEPPLAPGQPHPAAPPLVTAEALLITGEGVGTIRSGQVIDDRVLEKAFPGCEVTRHQQGHVSGTAIVHVWGLSCGSAISSIGDREIYVVAGDAKRRVVSVSFAGPDAKTREGIAVGSKVAELKKLGRLKCRLVPEEEMVGLGCVAVATPNIEFHFPAIPGAETSLSPHVRRPFAPDLDADREIVIIGWMARGRARK